MLRMNWLNTPAYKAMETDEQREEKRPQFESFGFMLLGTGIGRVTPKNLFELWARMQVMSGLAEFASTREAYAAVTRDDIRQMLYFEINQMDEARSKWIKRQMDGAIMTAQYHDRQDEQRKQEEANAAAG